MSKIILITGASSGFGLITAQTLALAGHHVFASMRDLAGKNAAKAQALRDFAYQRQVQLTPLEVDVTDDESVQAGVREVLQQAGGLDVLINNAGMLCIGITEAFTMEQVWQVFNTNLLSVMRLNRAVLPHFRERQAGLLVYVGSVTSSIVSPFQGPYVASKAAEDKIAETTHYEVSRFGIDSVIVQPGAYTAGTHHFAGALQPADTATAAAYTPLADLPSQLAAGLDRLVAAGSKEDVQDVADAIRRVIDQRPGERPFRVVVDPQFHGVEPINAVTEQMQTYFMQRMGIADLMQVQRSATNSVA